MIFSSSNCNCIDCQKLTTIIIGSNTFTHSNTLRIINNEKLATIDMGEGAFGGVNAVENTEFEISSIWIIDCVTVIDLPSIKLIEFRKNSMNNFVEAHASSKWFD